jgi:hypothetical protein
VHALKRKTVRMVLNANTSLKILTKKGQVSIKNYKENMNKEELVEEAIDLDHLQEMSFPSESESTLTQQEDEKSEFYLRKVISKSSSKDTKCSNQHKAQRMDQMENRIDVIEEKMCNLRKHIRGDVEALLKHYIPQNDVKEDY